MFMLQTLTVLSLTVIFLASVEGKGVQMQRDVQCCMLYSQGKVRTKDVLRFEVQTEGPDCSIQAIILYTKKAVKCADPRDRKVKRLLRKLLQRQRLKNHRTMWLPPRDNLPAMSEDKKRQLGSSECGVTINSGVSRSHTPSNHSAARQL